MIPVMKRLSLLAAFAAILLSFFGCSGAKEDNQGNYLVACGDRDLYIVDASASEGDSDNAGGP